MPGSALCTALGRVDSQLPCLDAAAQAQRDSVMCLRLRSRSRAACAPGLVTAPRGGLWMPQGVG